MTLFDDVFIPVFDQTTGPLLTEALIRRAEERLGYKLPAAYLALLAVQNGGYLKQYYHRLSTPTRVNPTYAMIPDLEGIGGKQGIDSDTGSAYLIEEWQYPPIGVVISSDGHTAVMLDYRACGPHGEPAVVFIDTETEDGTPAIVPLAPDFATFLAGLCDGED